MLGYNYSIGANVICCENPSSVNIENAGKYILEIIDILPDNSQIHVDDYILSSLEGVYGKLEQLGIPVENHYHNLLS